MPQAMSPVSHWAGRVHKFSAGLGSCVSGIPEQGVGGGALTTLRHATEGEPEMTKCFVRREKTSTRTSYHMYADGGDFLLSAHAVGRPDATIAAAVSGGPR